MIPSTLNASDISWITEGCEGRQDSKYETFLERGSAVIALGCGLEGKYGGSRQDDQRSAVQPGPGWVVGLPGWGHWA